MSKVRFGTLKGGTGVTEEQLVEIINDYLYEHPVTTSIRYTQDAPLATWIFSHPFGREPSVSIYDNVGNEIDADVSTTNTHVTIQFGQPLAGSAIIG